MTARSILLVVHTGRRAALAAAREIADRLTGAGIGIRVLDSESDALGVDPAERVPATDAAAARRWESRRTPSSWAMWGVSLRKKISATSRGPLRNF